MHSECVIKRLSVGRFVSVVVWTWLGLQAPTVQAAPLPEDVLIAYSSSLTRALINDHGEIMEICSSRSGFRRGGTEVVGAAMRSDGRVVVGYTTDPGPDSQIDSVFEVQGQDCEVEAAFRYRNRQFSGLAVGPDNSVWVSDVFTNAELLKINPDTGDVEARVEVGALSIVRTVDAQGQVYLGVGSGTRVLSADGQVLREVPASFRQIDRAGHLWRLGINEVFELTADGRELRRFPVGSFGGGFTLGKSDRLWVGTGDDPPAVAEYTRRGRFVRNVILDVPELNQAPPAQLVFTSAGAGNDAGGTGDGCNATPSGAGSHSGAGVFALGILAWIVRRSVRVRCGAADASR